MLGACYNKTALTVLERYGDPRRLRRLGVNRLATVIRRASGGQWGTEEATELINAATEATTLWQTGGLDFDELAWDLAAEVRTIRSFDDEIARLEQRITELYNKIDPTGIVTSVPGVGTVLAAGILSRLGDANRFATLAGIRAFSGIVPAVNQTGFSETRPGITKRGDAGLRRDLWLAADVARHIDPQLAAKYHRLITERQLHHYSALSHLATTLLTRIAACWRRDVIRDVDGRRITTNPQTSGSAQKGVD